MENEIKTFKYGCNVVRVIEINNETWWILMDVCAVLELSNPTIVADRLDDDEKDFFKPKSDLVLDLPNRGVIIINESGLYSVILRSDKPEAKNFKRWITHEVLPEIRRTGGYKANFTDDQKIKIARVLAKSTRHALPYILKILGLEKEKSAGSSCTLSVTPVTPVTEKDELDDFLAEVNVVGMISAVAYEKYKEFCKTEPMCHITFSKQVIKRQGLRTYRKKIKGVAKQVFCVGSR